MKPVAQSADEDIAALDAVCERLTAFGADVSTEWFDGFLTALVASRRLVMPSEWLPAMFGDDFGRAFADPADVQQAMAALMGRWNVLANQLDPESLIDQPDRLRLTPLMAQNHPVLRRRVAGADRRQQDRPASARH